MTGSNPQTLDEARAFVAHVQSLFMPWDIPGLLAGFTEDCVVRFGDLPETRGKAALEQLFRSRSERQKDYRLKKELRALTGDTIANYWQGEGRARGRDLADARRQDRGLGSRLQLQRGGPPKRDGPHLNLLIAFPAK